MICWIRHFRFYFLIVSLACLIACHDTNKINEAPKTEPFETPDKLVSKPLNCPAILTAHRYKKWKTGQVWLRFQIEQNKNYEPNLGDACHGDMKNLWQDIKYFEELIEEYNPKLSHISRLFGQNLDYFPATKEQVKHFVDKKAADVSLTSQLKSHDRSTQEGGMEIQRASRRFLMQTLQEYFNQEHKPIIDTYLNEHSLKMGHYSGEKLQFCYKSFNRCEYLFTKPISQNENLDFEFIGMGFDWWQFEHDKPEKTD